MTFEEYLASTGIGAQNDYLSSLGFTGSLQNGSPTWTNPNYGEAFTFNPEEDLGNQLNQFAMSGTPLDSQGRPVFGTQGLSPEGTLDFMSGGQQYHTLNPVGRYSGGISGGIDAELQRLQQMGINPIYDPARGYGIPMSSVEQAYPQSPLDMFSYGPIALGGLALSQFALPDLMGMIGGEVPWNPAFQGTDGFGFGGASPPDSYWNMVADAGGGTLTDAAAGTGGLTQAQIADIVAAEGGYSALPSAGMAGTAAGAAPVSSLTSPGFFPGTTNYAPGVLSSGGTTAGTGGLAGFLTQALPGNSGGLAGFLGKIAPSVLGAFGANAQANAYEDVANQYLGLGAPYRDLLLGSYQPGFSLENEPGYKQALETAQDTFLRAASAGRASGVSRGNPLDQNNPGAWAETQKYVMGSTLLPYLQNYRNTLAGAGGLGVSQSAPAALGAAQGTGNIYNAIGYGLDQIFNPKVDYGQKIFDMMEKNPGRININVGGLA